MVWDTDSEFYYTTSKQMENFRRLSLCHQPALLLGQTVVPWLNSDDIMNKEQSGSTNLYGISLKNIAIGTF